jgi:hypothetical protein
LRVLISDLVRGRLSKGLPVLVGVLTFAFVWVGQAPPGFFTDFDYFWIAGHAVWRGLDPYAVTREAIEQGTHLVPFYYPATAAVLLAPFGALSRHLALALFTALGMGLLAASVDGWRRWIVLSPPALQAIMLGQWSPWLTAAVGLPWLGFVWAGKPSIGLGLFAGWPSRLALAGGLAILLLSLILLPDWPADWLQALREAPQYTAPVQRVGGPLLLLAFLRWRRPEARLLGLMALIPHTTGIYEQLPLLLIPQTKRTFVVLMGLSYLAAVLVYTVVPYEHSPNVLLRVQRGLTLQWPYFLFLVWLPALYMVLRPSVLATPTPSADRRQAGSVGTGGDPRPADRSHG